MGGSSTIFLFTAGLSKKCLYEFIQRSWSRQQPNPFPMSCRYTITNQPPLFSWFLLLGLAVEKKGMDDNKELALGSHDSQISLLPLGFSLPSRPDQPKGRK
jgi:hypothetical protein